MSVEKIETSKGIVDGKFAISQLEFQPICEPINSSTQKIFLECCEFSEDGRILVFSGADGVIRVVELETKQAKQRQGHEDVIWGVAVSSNDELICTCSSDKTVKVWKIDSLELVATSSEHTDTVWSVKFANDSNHVISCSSDLKIIIWSFASENLSHRVLLGHTNVVEDIVLSPNGRLLVTCSRDCTLRVWKHFWEEENSVSTKSSSILKGHRNRVTCCVFAPRRNDIVASTSADCTVIVWNIVSKSILRKLSGHYNVVWSCSFFKVKAELFLVSCSSDHSLIFWDMSNGDNLRRLKGFGSSTGSGGQLLCCKVSQDAKKIAVTTSDGCVFVANIQEV